MTKFCEKYPDLCFENRFILGNIFDNTQPNLFPKIPIFKPAESPSDTKKKLLEKTFGEQGKALPHDPVGSKVPFKRTFEPHFRAKPQGIRPTISTLPEDAVMKANMNQAGRVFDETLKATNNDQIKATLKAQEYLDNLKIEWYVEPQLSTGQGLVLVSPEGEVIISYRGTDGENPKDLITDILAFKGKEKLSPEWKEVKTQMDLVIETLGKPEELIGFSRGGVLAMNLGNEYGINTTEFNPLITNQVLSSQADSIATHLVYRTIGDPVSAKLKGDLPSFKDIAEHLYKGTTPEGSMNAKGGIIVESILPKVDTLNAWGEHLLVQFLDNDTPRRMPVQELLIKNVTRQGKRFDELKQVEEIQDSIAEKLTFGEHTKNVSPRDFNEDSFSARYDINSPQVELWLEQGGELTQSELESLQNNRENRLKSGQPDKSNAYATTEEERTEFASKSIEEQATQLSKQQEQVFNAGETLDNFNADPEAIKASLLEKTTIARTTPETSAEIVKNLHPTNLGVGFVGGLAGFGEATGIRKGVKAVTGIDIGDASTQAIGGALGATNVAIGSSLLSGEALTATALIPEVIAGAGGAFLGYEAQQIIAQQLKDAGANEDTVQSVSDILGGAVGGFTTAGIAGIGSLIAGGALSGAELGSILAPETFGASILLGTAVGAVFGAGAYAVGKIEEAGSDLLDAIEHPDYDPYYVPPYFQMDSSRTMEYLQEKNKMDALRQQDIANGITPEQRGNIGIPPQTSINANSTEQASLEDAINYGVKPEDFQVEYGTQFQTQEELEDFFENLP